MTKAKKIRWGLICAGSCIIINLIFGQALITKQEHYGYLNVNSNPMGLVVYLDGDSIGITPISNYQLKPKNYTISLFATESIEHKYWRFSEGGLATKYATLLDLAKIGAGTRQVVIKANQTSEVFFSLSQINRTPTKIKIATSCCLGSGFTIAFVLGYLVATLIQ